jgi:predicted dehydrogenase
MKDNPLGVVATGESHLNGYVDVAYITVYYPNNVIAHVNVNWLSPVKVRTTLIGGEKKMLVWNDLEVDEKIRVYDRGVTVENEKSVYDLLVSYRSGDMWSPKIDQVEALENELKCFVDCILEDKEPHNNGTAGLKVVKMLEAADRSLKRRGEVVEV